MAGDAGAVFSCGACGRSYKWKPQIAGKTSTCKCGQKVQVPVTDPAAAQPAAADDLGLDMPFKDELIASPPVSSPAPPQSARPAKPAPADDDMYDFADDPAPKRPGPVPAAAVSAARPAAAAPAGAAVPAGMLGYAKGPTRIEVEREKDLSGYSMTWDFIVPGVLVGIGTIGLVINYVLNGAFEDFGVLPLVIFVGIYIAYNVVVSFVTFVAIANIVGMSFGALGPAIIKVVGIVMFTLMIDSVLSNIPTFGWLLAWAAQLSALWILLSKLFDLDISEVMFTTAALWVVQTIGTMFLVAALMRWLGGGF